ncbi:nuclear factor, interleukin 3 regulated, member 6 [Alosa sapidissima]|uniref:nuclear factor, interleukin 3 regulated, member 6 n=1 Tax=Alosa sapidissima TaxID=34773 RepID=UPI001C087054|nr:nuclear factor, interleukin 3 regulated, member 6 [Alosa sapidissima]
MSFTAPGVFPEESQDMREHGSLGMQVLDTPMAPGVRGLEMASPNGARTFTDEAVSILTSSSLLARSLLGRNTALKRKEQEETESQAAARRKREFIPQDKKDDSYWDKRKKNNEAAKRSREKRRVNDMVLESRVLALLEENARLRAELLALKFRFGLVKDPSSTPILPLTAQSPPPAQHCYLPSLHPSQPSGLQLGPRSLGGAGGGVTSRGDIAMGDAGSMSSEDSGFSTPGGSSVGSPVFFEERLAGERDIKLSPRPSAEDQACEAHLHHLHHSATAGGSDGLLHHAAGPAGSPMALHLSGELSQVVGKLEGSESMKCLPHKLRFKSPGCSDTPVGDSRGSPHPTTITRGSLQPHIDGGEGTVAGFWSQEGEHAAPSAGGGGQGLSDPSSQAETHMLKSQLSSLCEEVAQLKRLFSSQLVSKTN